MAEPIKLTYEKNLSLKWVKALAVLGAVQLSNYTWAFKLLAERGEIKHGQHLSWPIWVERLHKFACTAVYTTTSTYNC